MSEKAFEGYKIICAYIDEGTPVTRMVRPNGDLNLYDEICLTLEPIGCNVVNPEAHNIWEQTFNELAEKWFSRHYRQVEYGNTTRYIPWRQITCGYKEGVPTLRVSKTTSQDIEEHLAILNQLVEESYVLAQEEIDKVNEKVKHTEEDRQQLKELKWD